MEKIPYNICGGCGANLSYSKNGNPLKVMHHMIYLSCPICELKNVVFEYDVEAISKMLDFVYSKMVEEGKTGKR